MRFYGDAAEDMAYESASDSFDRKRDRLLDLAAKFHYEGREDKADEIMAARDGMVCTGLCWDQDPQNAFDYNEHGDRMEPCRCGVLTEPYAPCGSPECYIGAYDYND